VTQSSGAATALRSVKVVNLNVAWIGGNGGRVLRTVNSGTTWTSVGGGAIGTADVYAVEARNADTAFATTTPTAPAATFIYRTTNRGSSWTQVYTDPNAAAFINVIKMFDNNNGIAMGDPVGGKWVILRTSDGGASWLRDTVNAPVQVGTEAGSNNGLAVVGSTHIWFPANSTTKVYRSTNGGATWASSIPPYTATFTAGIWFNTTQLGVIGANGGQAARTTDGGATWSSVTIGTTGTIYGVWGNGSDFFASRGANVFRSTDGGVTWTSSWTGTIGSTLWHMNFVAVGSNTRGYVVSSTGGIGAFYGGLTGVREDRVGGARFV